VSGRSPPPDESGERLVERVLADPAFRARLRQDPASQPALETLELRESKSSMAGALMAAAVEGLALFELAGHGGLGADAAEAAVRPPADAAAALLDNPNVELDAAGVADLRAGRIDARIIAVLEEVSRRHRVTVSAMLSDHGVRTAGGSISNHHFGRAADIAAIDGQPVSPGNAAARALAESLLRLDPAIRPTELGSPWALGDPAAFTDGDHQDHIHVAYDDPPPPGWRPPAPVPDDVSAPDESPGPGDDADRDDIDEPDDSSGDDADLDAADESDDSSDDDADLDDADESDDSSDDADEDDDDGDEDEEDDEEDSDGEDEDEPDEEEPDEEEPDEVGPDFDDLTDDEYQAAAARLEPSAGARLDPSAGARLDPSAGARLDPSADAPPGPAADAVVVDIDGAPTVYPGDDAPPERVAAWMAVAAQRRGLPPELPVMAALVESGMRNLSGGDADSVGFFQMRTSIWNSGPYAGYSDDPELQLDWFLDHAEQLPARGPDGYGEWIADVERPAEQYRGRYQLRLDEARELLRGFRAPAAPDANQAQVLPVIRPDQVTRRPR
jgi:hypothetical protein